MLIYLPFHWIIRDKSKDSFRLILWWWVSAIRKALPFLASPHLQGFISTDMQERLEKAGVQT